MVPAPNIGRRTADEGGPVDRATVVRSLLAYVRPERLLRLHPQARQADAGARERTVPGVRRLGLHDAVHLGDGGVRRRAARGRALRAARADRHRADRREHPRVPSLREPRETGDRTDRRRARALPRLRVPQSVRRRHRRALRRRARHAEGCETGLSVGAAAPRARQGIRSTTWSFWKRTFLKFWYLHSGER